jgi:hypothetical protein
MIGTIDTFVVWKFSSLGTPDGTGRCRGYMRISARFTGWGRCRTLRQSHFGKVVTEEIGTEKFGKVLFGFDERVLWEFFDRHFFGSGGIGGSLDPNLGEVVPSRKDSLTELVALPFVIL